MEITCPNCKAVLESDTSLLGQEVQCPNCSTSFVVPKVIATSSVPSTAAPSSKSTKVPNYMVWSILATLLCCLPFGIVGIIYSAKTTSLVEKGDYSGALAASAKAKVWCVVSLILGIVMSITIGVISILSSAKETAVKLNEAAKTRTINNGKQVCLCVISGNIDREANGLSPIWPTFGEFTNAEECFSFLSSKKMLEFVSPEMRKGWSVWAMDNPQSDDVPFLVSSNVKQIKERYPEDGLALTSIADSLVVDESILPFKDEIIVIDRDGKVLSDDWALMCLKEGMKGSWQLLGED